MNEVVYTYDGSFDGFLSCVFARYANKEVPIAICRDEDFPPTLFPCRFIPTDPAHARRVLRKVLTLSPYGARLLQRGFLTCLPDRELALLNLVTTLLEEGPGFLRDRSHPAVYPVFRAVRHLEGEAHVLKGPAPAAQPLLRPLSPGCLFPLRPDPPRGPPARRRTGGDPSFGGLSNGAAG